MAFDPTGVIADYGDPVGEAVACRTSAALFDFSFMSRAVVAGQGALNVIAALTRRPLHDLPVGRICYALRETPEGYLAADLTVWRIGPNTFEVMSGRPVDIADLAAAAVDYPDAQVRDLTAQTRIYAVQGPRALDVLRPLMSERAVRRLADLSYYATADFSIDGMPVRIGRLGYTGERGFELVLPACAGETVWKALASRARPAGFVAADALRIEAGFVLFANEFRLPVTATEAGLGAFASGAPTHRPDAASEGSQLCLVEFRAATQADVALFQPRPPLHRPNDDNTLLVTSACNSVAASGVLGLGYVRQCRRHDVPLRDPTGTFRNIQLVQRPYYDPEKRRPRLPWD